MTNMKSKTLIVAILLLAGFSTFVVSFPNVGQAIALPTEDTLPLCTDGIDNNGNFLVDLSDPDCAPFAVPTPTPTPAENTLALCTDSIDNNGNFLVDLSDPDCAPFAPTPTPTLTPSVTPTPTPSVTPSVTPTPTPTPVNTGGGGQIILPTPTPTTTPTPTPTGSVLGAATSTPDVIVVPINTSSDTSSCPLYITDYLKFGAKNNPEQVKKLQQYLNDKIGSKLPITGYFGPLTLKAVKNLHALYADQILKPWVDQGVVAKLGPTGYVYITTKWFINSQLCPSLNLSLPNLK